MIFSSLSFVMSLVLLIGNGVHKNRWNLGGATRLPSELGGWVSRVSIITSMIMILIVIVCASIGSGYNVV